MSTQRKEAAKPEREKLRDTRLGLGCCLLVAVGAFWVTQAEPNQFMLGFARGITVPLGGLGIWALVKAATDF